MDIVSSVFGEKSRLGVLLEHFSAIEDPRQEWRVLYPLPEILLLVVCGTIADCDEYEAIVAWGEQHLGFLRR
ncbi:MAG TPA: transposase family protein, partial [Stellaceae bacterium]